jgi:uncharacterized protein (DUF927 family)
MEMVQNKMIDRFTLIRLHNHALYAPDKKGERWYEVCNEVGIDRILINLVTEEIVLYLKYWVHGKYHTLEMYRKDFTKSGLVRVLPARGIQIAEDTAESLLDYLLYREKKTRVEYIHDQVGFKTVNGKRVFLHYHAHSADNQVKSTYTGSLMIKPKGTSEGELNLIREEILGNTALELAWVLGFTAPMISFLRGKLALDNLIIHSYGKSSTGKTTSSLLSISPFGLPSKSSPNGLFSTWMSTPNALIGRLANNTGIPMVYDEASVQDPKVYSKIIYQMSAGLEKSRLSADSTMKGIASWSCAILSNAENALLTRDNYNSGLRVRVLQLKNISWTHSAESSERITSKLQENYGNCGGDFVERLLSYPEEDLLARFKEAKMKVLNAFNKRDDFSSRASDKLAVIYLTAQLVNEVFNIGINLVGILGMLIEADEDQVEDRNIGLQAYLSVKEQVTCNLNKFVFKDGLSNNSFLGQAEYMELPRNEIYGRIVSDSKKKPSEVWILRNKLDAMLKAGGFTDADVVLSDWRDKGVISCDKGKFTKKRTLFNDGDTIRVVVMKLKDNEYENIDNASDETVQTIRSIKGIYVREPVEELVEEDIF